MKQLTPEKAIDITWLSVALCFCWPLPSNSSRTRIALYKILQISSSVSGSLVFLALIYSIYLHSKNTLVLCKYILMSITVSQQVVQTIICMINHDSLQVSFYSLLLCIRCKEIYVLTMDYSTWSRRC
mgnify:CR=1 FL=1